MGRKNFSRTLGNSVHILLQVLNQKCKFIVFLIQVCLTFAAGILLFFLVEKVVRYIDENSSQGVHGFHHGHHHHHKSNISSKKDEDQHGPSKSTFVGQRESSDSDKAHESKSLDADADADANGNAAERKENQLEMTLRKVR